MRDTRGIALFTYLYIKRSAPTTTRPPTTRGYSLVAVAGIRIGEICVVTGRFPGCRLDKNSPLSSSPLPPSFFPSLSFRFALETFLLLLQGRKHRLEKWYSFSLHLCRFLFPRGGIIREETGQLLNYSPLLPSLRYIFGRWNLSRGSNCVGGGWGLTYARQKESDSLRTLCEDVLTEGWKAIGKNMDF